MGFQKNVVPNEKSKNSNNCLKYLMILGFFVFITLIIMLSVTVSVSEKNNLSYKAVGKFDFTKRSMYFDAEGKESPSLFAVACTDPDADCTLQCEVSSNDRQALITELERIFENCDQPMHLTLRGTPFGVDETFGKEDLDGKFEVRSLTLDKCDKFSKIEDNAFDKQSLSETLWYLQITQKQGYGLETMNENTFKGLKNLKRFIFKNTVAPKKLTAKGVLTPLAESLEDLKFEQTSVVDSIAYDPGSWFGDAVYLTLQKVDLRNNYFPGILNEYAFDNLKSVSILYLAGCSIEAIRDRTFEAMLGTLRELDLSNNELSTLSITILKGFSEAYMALNLIGNHWDCTCDNREFVEFIQEDRLNIFGEPKCAGPPQWANRDVVLVELCCEVGCYEEEGEDDTTTTTTPVTTSTPSPTTVSDYESTSETSTTVSPKPKPEVILCCKSDSDTNENKIQVQDQLTFFAINSVTATSVFISFKHEVTAYDLLYFTPHQIESSHQQAIWQTSTMLIEALISDCSYVFCLVASNAQLVAPFNCRAHHMKQSRESWLSFSDLTIFLAIVIGTTTVCFLIGISGAYCFLRCKRSLLVKKEFNFDSADMDSQPHATSFMDERGALKKYSSQKRADRLNSNTYVQYFNNAESPPRLEDSKNNNYTESPCRSTRLTLDLETITEACGDEFNAE